MSEIRAFVAHSFATGDQGNLDPGDEWVIGEFTKFFTEVQKLNSNFSWERADRAQPRGVKDKVISLWEGKNLFIGICTKKERVIPTTFDNLQQLSANELVWKTSDWIIQEIGFAIGRDCKLIILLEAGVRIPGGLIGDLEYIEFDRNNPSQCFLKLMQMVTTCVPQEALSSPLPSNATLVERPPVEKDNETFDGVWTQPQPDWKLREYQIALHIVFLTGEEQHAESINRQFLQSDEANVESNKVVWEAYCEWTRLEFGRRGSLDRLRGLASANPNNAEILSYLARGLSHYDLHKESSEVYDAASKVSANPDSMVRFAGQALRERVLDGKSDAEVAKDIESFKETALSRGVSETTVLHALEGVYIDLKDTETTLLIKHRILEIDATDSRTRHSLAYQTEAKGNRDLALFHYTKIMPSERDGTIWNNLGVVQLPTPLP